MFGSNNNNEIKNNEGKAQFIYRCIRNCTHGGKFYKKGSTMILPEKKEVPHFKLVEKQEKEK